MSGSSVLVSHQANQRRTFDQLATIDAIEGGTSIDLGNVIWQSANLAGFGPAGAQARHFHGRIRTSGGAAG